MILRGIKKKVEGKFTTLYNLIYENKNGKKKVYEMLSYDKNLSMKNKENLSGKSANSIVLFVFNKDKTKVLLNKEYRLSVNHEIYNTIAGLIEPNENYILAARRELKEESGLDLVDIIEILPSSFSAIGVSNEKSMTIICTADGEIDSSKAGEDEELESFWVDKEKAKEILEDRNGYIAARTQMFLYFWLNWRENSDVK